MQSNRRRVSGDDGSILTIALVFLIVGGLIIAGLLSQAELNLKTTSIVKSRAERLYAADAAIEAGIDQLRLDPSVCSATGGTVTLNAPAVNNKNVTLRCTPVYGDDFGAGSFAAIVRRRLDRQSGGEPTLKGSVFVTDTPTGLDNHLCDANDTSTWNNCLTVVGGNMIDNSPGCPSSTPLGILTRPFPPYRWQCKSIAIPAPAHELPLAPTLVNPPPLPPALNGGCTVWSPGKYTIPPTLGTDNLFVAGAYYFEFDPSLGSEVWSIPNNTNVIAGHSDSYSVPDLAPTPCAGVADSAGVGSTGSGVEWIFGRNSSVELNGINFEMRTRTPAVGELSPAGKPVTPNINVYAVETSGNGYIAENGILFFNLKTGSSPKVAVHGMAYAPTADLSLFATQGTGATFRNGIVARDLFLQPSSAGIGLAISVEPTASARGVLLTATASESGRGDVAADARVEIRNDTDPPTPVVQSWRTCGTAAAPDPAHPPTPACP